MKILLDECLPKDLKKEFHGHSVKTARELKWNGKKNGELLSLAVKNGFLLFVTVDSSLIHQQNLKKFPIIIASIKATSNDIAVLQPIAAKISRRAGSLMQQRIYRFA